MERPSAVINGAFVSSGLFFGQSAWHGLGTLPADSPERFSVNDSIASAA
jgi:hypothetical protein